METRSLNLPLTAPAAPATTAQVRIDVLSPRERARRAALALAAGLGLALIALPIPLVHFLLVPGALVAGIALAALRLRQRETFRSADGCCPYCGARQRFAAFGPVRLPKRLYCASCQRELYLTAAEPASPA